MDMQSKAPKYTESKQSVEKACGHTVPAKRLYSIKELVSEVGATAWFWRSQIWDGQLPYVQVGRKMFIDSNDVESVIKKNKHAYCGGSPITRGAFHLKTMNSKNHGKP